LRKTRAKKQRESPLCKKNWQMTFHSAFFGLSMDQEPCEINQKLRIIGHIVDNTCFFKRVLMEFVFIMCPVTIVCHYCGVVVKLLFEIDTNLLILDMQQQETMQQQILLS